MNKKKSNSLYFLKKIFMLFIASILLQWNPDSVFSEIVDKVVAKINSEIITLSEINEKAHVVNLEKKIEQQDGKIDKKQIESLVNLMIDEILQIQYAKKIGLKVEDQVVYSYIDEIKKKNSLTDTMFIDLLKKDLMTYDGYVKKLRNQMMISKLMDAQIKSRIIVEMEEINAYYEKNKNNFMDPESVNVRHILFFVPEDMEKNQKDKKHAQAKEVLTKLKRNADFIDLAKAYSDGPNAKAGGETGFFKRGTMSPLFEDIAFSLKEGEISPIIETKLGLHIIKVIEKRRLRAKELKAVKAIIQNKLYKEKVIKKYKEWMNELRASSYIDVLP